MKNSISYWLVKQEPSLFSWDQFVNEGHTAWTGVRNYQARNYLRSMKKGDLVLFYHSRIPSPCIVGIASVAKEAYPDPTALEGEWSCVDLIPEKKLLHEVSLAKIKAEALLQELPLLKQSRLSVMPVKEREFEVILNLSQEN